MAGSGSLGGGGALLGWRSQGGRHFQALAQAHPIVQARAEEEDGGGGVEEGGWRPGRLA